MWREKTNRGRVVYNRKPHGWSEKDVERVVRGFTQSLDANPDVPMMSDLADKVLFWIGDRLDVDGLVAAASTIVSRLVDWIQGNNVRNGSETRSRALTKEEQDLLDWMSEQAGAVRPPVSSRQQNLVWIRNACSSIIEIINQEIPQE